MNLEHLSLPYLEQVDLRISELNNDLGYYKALRRACIKYPDIRMRHTFRQFPFSKSISKKVSNVEIDFCNYHTEEHGSIVAIIARFSHIIHRVAIFSCPVDIIVGKCKDGMPIMFDNIDTILTKNNIPRKCKRWVTDEVRKLQLEGKIPTWNVDEDD